MTTTDIVYWQLLLFFFSDKNSNQLESFDNVDVIN